ncbi:hypothetical protein P3875_11325 [Myroides sp. JBRI-B21084]|uniref:hypothetical protein n=1 Tax=Myroides sp. JBRI-B21084 TaxID=3119977 RepID=UPI0026E40291|nr:hypothetical protein [Paenimyroides cloacae]WKW46348.1 hypothetical protein P3875_11325 [Paenimyroides cloacae]
MQEIITAIQNWMALRSQPDQLVELFNTYTGFEIDMSLFPQREPLHAYAAVKSNGEFGFYVISQVNDVDSPDEVLSANCFWCGCTGGMKGQEITEAEALVRIDLWQADYPVWIPEVVTTPFGIYETFFIPTEDLQPQTYNVSFALKADVLNPSGKVADLILNNGAGVYYDTVRREPPYRNRSNYYILNLL